MSGIPDAPLADVAPQIQEGQLSEVATPDMFGSGVGRAVAQWGEVESRIYHDANASAVTAARNKVDAAAQEKLYNPKTGLLYQNYGERAAPEVDKVASDYKANVSETRAGLTNDDQRAMFDKAMGEHGLQYQRILGEYEHKQVTNGQNANTAAFIQNRQNDIAQNYHDPLFAHASIGMIRDSLMDAYARNNAMDPMETRKQVAAGTEPEELKEALLKADSGSHMLVMNTAMANDQNGYARTYFEANKGQLTATDLDKATSMVRAGALHDEARATTDEIIAEQKKNVRSVVNIDGQEFERWDGGNSSLEAQLDNLEKRKIDDTQLHDLIRDRLIKNYGIAKEAHAEQQSNLSQQASDQMEKSPTCDISADVLGQLDFKNRKNVEKRQADLRAKGKTDTNEAYKQDFLTRAKDQSQWDEVMKIPRNELRANLNNPDFQDALNELKHIETQQKNQTRILSQGMMSSEEVAGLKQQYGLEQQPLKKDEDINSPARQAIAERWNNFQDQLQAENGALALKQGHPCSREQISANARMLFTSTTWREQLTKPEGSYLGALGWGDRFETGPEDPNDPNSPQVSRPRTSVERTKPFFESPNANKVAYRIQDIPQEERDGLVKKAEKNGVMKPTDQQLIDAYNLKLGIRRATP